MYQGTFINGLPAEVNELLVVITLFFVLLKNLRDAKEDFLYKNWLFREIYA